MSQDQSSVHECLLYINGEFRSSSTGDTFDLTSPTTLEVVAKVHEASVEDTNAAVAAAKAAFPAWSALSPRGRGVYLAKLGAAIREHEAEFAHLEAISMGRPVSTYFDAAAAATRFEHYAEHGWSVQGTTSLNTPGFVNMVFRQPYGVAGAIIPWNVPLLMFSGKVASALAAGNTVVVKSSEKAPLTSFKLAQLIQEAGFPLGVVNVLSGHGHISGNTMASHMDIGVLSFTGSLRTGRLIQKAAADSNLKKVILELGGKSPAIIFDDADITVAVQETKHSVQWNSGQVCMANTRIYVQDTIADSFIARFATAFQSVTMGDPTDPKVNHGPQADSAQYKTINEYIKLGKTEGKLYTGGSENDRKGYFVQPTIFTETPEGSRIMKEEIFGPVVNINTFHTEAEAISAANDTDFGLYAAVYTKDIDRALRVAKALDAGTVGVNCTSPTGAFDAPFGGYKLSGVGREGTQNSLDNFLETKSVLIKIQDNL